MKKYQKTAPVGIDYTIQMIQDMQERVVPSYLGVLASECLFYGRGEMVKRGDPAVMVTAVFNGKDYDYLGYDDRYKLVTYIVPDQDRPNTNPDLMNVMLYVHGDVKQIFPSLTTRGDEELRRIYTDFMYTMIEPVQIRSIELIDDLQPIHSFRINFTI